MRCPRECMYCMVVELMAMVVVMVVVVVVVCGGQEVRE